MLRLLWSFAIICLSTAVLVEGKVYTKCEVAQALKKALVPIKQISTFVCIARYESDYNTAAINHQTGDYGIFQISHYYWCNDGSTPGKGCHITCKSLLSDDISGDIKCIKQIYEETQKEEGNGFSAWTTYKAHCAGNTDEFTKGCF